MSLVVLTYHSHHVVGAGYAENDHVAFESDLATITRCGYRIVPLATLVDRLQDLPDEASTKVRYVALTLDDGPAYDVDDFDHPEHGRQRSFLNAMRRFRDERGAACQPGLHATSFVIASAEARAVMERHADPVYTYLTPGSMTDQWWCRALDSGLIGIANHSFDHLHPALPRVAHSRQARADFTQVDNEADADAQLLAAARTIDRVTHGRASPFFAFPFGHVNAFLTDSYLPRRSHDIGVRAAFTTRPDVIRPTDSRWSLPRFTCGHHWTSPDALAALLES